MGLQHKPPLEGPKPEREDGRLEESGYRGLHTDTTRHQSSNLMSLIYHSVRKWFLKSQQKKSNNFYVVLGKKEKLTPKIFIKVSTSSYYISKVVEIPQSMINIRAKNFKLRF